MPAGGLISFEVKLQGPLDVAASVERFRRWGDDLIDLWYGGTMVRALHLADGIMPFAATPVGTIDCPRLTVFVDDADKREAVTAALRATFVQADLRHLAAYRMTRDPGMPLADVILSFRVSRGCDLWRPVVDSVADETPAA